MANEVKKFVQELGYQPLEDRCIIIKYAPENLSEQIMAFFNSEFYVLQMCEHEIVLLPFNTTWGNLRKDISLVLPYEDIQSVALEESVPAPVALGDRLGTLTVSSGEETVAEIPLLAGEEVPRITYGQMFLRLLRTACLAE